MALGVSQNRLDSFGRDFKLFCDFSGADAIIEVSTMASTGILR